MRRLSSMVTALMAMFWLLGCDYDLPNTAKAVDDNATVASGQSVTIDVLANDEESSGVRDPVKWIRSATQPTHGTVVVDNNSTIIYTADAGFVGKDRFTYTLGINNMTDEANVTVTVTSAPLPPVALPQADAGKNAAVTVGTQVELNGTCSIATGTIESCIWYEGDTRLEHQEAMRGGAASATQQRIRLLYTPTTAGTHTLKLIATDDKGATGTDEVNVTATAAASNAAPTANAGEDKTVEVNHPVTLTGSCTDADGSIASCIWSENGQELSSDASFDYTPSSEGIHTLTLTATDDKGATGTDEVNVTATAPAPQPHEKALFSWDDGTHGQEPWVTDGTVDGTKMLKDIGTDGNASSPAFSDVVINAETFFTATKGDKMDNELWKTDGTTTGTVQVADIAPEEGHGSWPRDLCLLENHVYFFALDGDTNDSNNWDGNTSIWKSTGEVGNATKVENFGSFAGTSYAAPGYLRCVGDKLFFQKDYDAGNGSNWNPWVSDGTNAATRLGGDTFKGTTKHFRWNGVVYHGIYYAEGDDGDKGDEVWGWNPANGNVSILKDTNKEDGKGSNPSDFIVANDKLFFTAENPREDGDPAAYDKSLWVSDGSTGNTQVIKDDTAPSPTVGSRNRFSDLTVMDARLYFVYLNLDENNDTIGIGTLWSTDGSTPNLVKDIDVVSGTLDATEDALFFQVDGNDSVRGLWTSDGTTNETHRVRAFGNQVYWADTFVKDGLYYFILDNCESRTKELWRSDGTADGTFKLLETHAGGD